jgi:hypothetical protein
VEVDGVTALARPGAAGTASEGLEATSEPPGSSPAVIYIAGSGRSGSTLLERALGAIPGFVNVGELIDLHRRTVKHGERCGCGQAFPDCPFWAAVGRRAFGGRWDEMLTKAQRLQERVARQRHLPRLAGLAVAGRSFRANVASYGAYYASLYRAIAAESGASWVVDASKWPVQALALARGGIDVRVVHLVRDVRGVAYSLSRRQLARPHAVAGRDLMMHLGPAEAAARWLACQSEAELLRLCSLPVTRVRYEEFVREPRGTVAAALAALGVPVSLPQLSHLGQTTVMLGLSHGLSGNPSRFQDGEVALRADDAWQAAMSRRDRFLVTTIGLPLLLRYRLGAASVTPQRPESDG